MVNLTSVLLTGLNDMRPMFYLVPPSESLFENISDIKDYVHKAEPFFFMFIFLELILLPLFGKRSVRINDSLASLSSGLIMKTVMFITKYLELVTYVWTYENFNLVKLPWNSAWTWWITFFGVDFCYYWFHRLAHEVNFMWAAHQVHHSSEDYNLTTALRQSIFQTWTSWIFYLPMALFIPPTVFLVHIQFNLLYQFWIHTQIIRKLGPLELILNTPSHHRVHHGRNRYCIDKNYAATLIIWDRMFGTFEAEDDEVVYGLTHSLESFNPIWVQMCHYMHILKTVWETKGATNKLSAIFKGPGWAPGKPRLGEIQDIPDVHAPVYVYNPKISNWLSGYMFTNFILSLLCYQELYVKQSSFCQLTIFGFVGYVILSLTAVGSVLDKRSYAPYLQIVSHSVFLIGLNYFGSVHFVPEPNNRHVTLGLQIYAALSLVYWIYRCARREPKSKVK